jgi:hypothetical protein
VQFVHKCSSRKRIGPRPSDPSDTDYRGFNRFHQTLPFHFL